MFLLAGALVCLRIGAARGQGAVLFQHSGAADPVSEGFTLLRAGNPLLAPVTNDMGLDAWSINQNSLSDIAVYSFRLTPQQEAEAALGGWALSLTLRVAPPYNPHPNAIFTALYVNSQPYFLQFGAATNGDPMLRVNSLNLTYTLNGAGPGYHNYQLKHDGGAANTSLWVDGALYADNVPAGAVAPRPTIMWGGSQGSFPADHANWSEVTLEVIPEPSCAALLGCGGLLLAAHRFRARRKLPVRKAHS